MALKVFISYAHQDEDLVKDLNKQLESLRQRGLITPWYDRLLLAGKEKIEIIRHLNASQIILLMISPDFLASNYHVSNEMQQAMLLRAKNKAHVIPVILRPTNWEIPPLDQLRALPTDGKPVTLWQDKDSAFLNITEGLRDVAHSLAGELGRGVKPVIDPPPLSPPPSQNRTPDAEDEYYEILRKQVEQELNPLGRLYSRSDMHFMPFIKSNLPVVNLLDVWLICGFIQLFPLLSILQNSSRYHARDA